MNFTKLYCLFALVCLFPGLLTIAQAQPEDEAAQLAMKLATPIANVISVPFQYNDALLQQMIKLGSTPAQIGIGARYWAKTTVPGPDDWGLRAQFTLLFP